MGGNLNYFVVKKFINETRLDVDLPVSYQISISDLTKTWMDVSQSFRIFGILIIRGTKIYSNMLVCIKEVYILPCEIKSIMKFQIM